MLLRLPALAGGSRAIAVGSRVEVQYRGVGSWMPATVDRVNGDDTYRVRYDDGETEERARAENVRAARAASTASARASTLDLSDSDDGGGGGGAGGRAPRLAVGADVECRRGRGGDWEPARITRVNSDHTFAVAFADGEVRRWRGPPASHVDARACVVLCCIVLCRVVLRCAAVHCGALQCAPLCCRFCLV